MSDIISVGRRVTSVDSSPQFSNYSKVIIHVSDDTTYEAGDDTGRVLEIDNPFGTQQMANDMLTSLRGYQYQPYEAGGALLNPAAEIGDAANVRGVYGGIYARKTNFGRLMKADVSAPQDEEIDHEYKYESPTERKFSRAISDVRASLIIANDRINAKVEQTGGDNNSFGWSLLADKFSLYSKGTEVFRADQDGVQVKGRVSIQSGVLGSDEKNGFTITASAIYNNINSMSSSQTTGVYIGKDGIRLGKNFKVDSSGNLTAGSGTFTGNVYAGNIKYGGSYGSLNGGGISGGTIGTDQLSTYVNGGIGGGINFSNAISGTYTPAAFGANILTAYRTLTVGTNFRFKDHAVSLGSIKDHDGDTQYVLKWS